MTLLLLISWLTQPWVAGVILLIVIIGLLIPRE
jgi:hypothetical protein